MANEDQMQQRERNALLKDQWDELTERIELATVSGEDLLAKRLTRKRDHISNDFCAENKGLATRVAQKFFASGGKANHDDYVADALYGLWEAFLKWDPAQSTFGNFSRSYMEGRVRRGVATLEAEGLSYGDFTARPDIRAAEERLAKKLGRQATSEEIGEECGQTAALVDRVRQSRPASLDKTVGDGDATLGDLVALGEWNVDTNDNSDLDPTASGVVDRLNQPAPGKSDKERMFAVLKDSETLDPAQLFVVVRYHGFDGAPPQRYPALQRITDVNRETLRRHMERAEGKVPELVTFRPSTDGDGIDADAEVEAKAS